MRRVAVTGLGILCAVGRGSGECWRSLIAGEPAIEPIAPEFGIEGLRFQNGAMVRSFEPLEDLDRETVQATDRFAQFALIAAEEAIRDAGLEWTDELRSRGAVITGSSTGGQTSADEQFQRLYGQNRTRVHPLSIPRIMASAATSFIAMRYGITGPSFTFSTACSSANHAMGHAFWMVRNGGAEVALCGGCEAPFSFGNLKAWEALRVVSPDTCRPFCEDRTGMILGEGAAMLVLEPLERAKARGALVYAEIAGFGMSSDAHHLTQPSIDGPVRAMRSALEDARLEPESVGYVNAHGTGTRANDATESKAIGKLFGAGDKRPAVSSTKSMHGHALGAAGALEAFATLMALRERAVPPTANFTRADPECDLDLVTGEARESTVDCALSNSFAFGGLNAVLAFRRFDG